MMKQKQRARLLHAFFLLSRNWYAKPPPQDLTAFNGGGMVRYDLQQ
jgi:hypothetical protein